MNVHFCSIMTTAQHSATLLFAALSAGLDTSGAPALATIPNATAAAAAVMTIVASASASDNTPVFIPAGVVRYCCCCWREAY